MLAGAVGVDYEDAVVAGARRVWGVKAFGAEDQPFAVRRPVGVEVGTPAAVGDLRPLMVEVTGPIAKVRPPRTGGGGANDQDPLATIGG